MMLPETQHLYAVVQGNARVIKMGQRWLQGQAFIGNGDEEGETAERKVSFQLLRWSPETLPSAG